MLALPCKTKSLEIPIPILLSNTCRFKSPSLQFSVNFLSYFLSNNGGSSTLPLTSLSPRQAIKRSGNMNDSLSLEEIFSGVSDDLFDEAIKYLDFPMGSLEPNNVTGGEGWDSLQGIEAAHENVLTSLSSGLHGDFRGENLDKRLPAGCAAEAYPHRSIFINGNAVDVSELIFYQTSSPTSVLESSSSCSGENRNRLNSELNFPVKKRARSNKRRPASTFNLHPVHHFPFSSSFAAGDAQFVATHGSEPENHYSDEPANIKQKKKKKLTSISGMDETSQSSLDQQVALRKCTHCQVTKTPQWREGPMGPKTLCNACGVRYRSGRLFPEYRPAASPTFIPSMHSNSHKKVVELRNKGAVDTGAIFSRAIFSPLAKNVT